MPKIKHLNNDELEQYLNAYRHQLDKSHNDPDLKEKVTAIEAVLSERALLGVTESPNSPKHKKSIFGFLKRKK